MSGFGGIYRRDGAPVDAGQVMKLEAGLRFRGPHGSGSWHQGEVGLAHALFVTDELRPEPVQPLHRTPGLSLVGDIRLDDRVRLVAELAVERSMSDSELVLAAYAKWGRACLSRIQGEFAFAIWDATERQLLCARDRFGVRPLFYVLERDRFVFSNTLEAVFLLPGVDRAFDELWIADFLVHGYPLDTESSVYRNVRRIAPGQVLVVQRDRLEKTLYGSLPVREIVRYRRPQQYVEEFSDVFARAVSDRASADTGLYLSGGLDSGAIAVALSGRLGNAALPGRSIHAFTTGFNTAFDDPEPAMARQTADALGIPLEAIEATDCVPFKGWECAEGMGPEPEGYCFRDLNTEALSKAALSCRVALNGQGGDEIFSSEVLLPELLNRRDWRLLLDAFHAWRVLRRPALGIRGLLRRGAPPTARIPEWIDRGWAERLALAERAQHAADQLRRPDLPNALARVRLASPLWPQYFELNDPGFTGVLLQQRWPFLDHRVIDFALTHPPFPWLMDKYLLRKVLRPHVPPEIHARPKTPVAGDPLQSFLSREPDWLAGQEWLEPYVRGWVDTRLLRGISSPLPYDPLRTWQQFRVVGLAHWVRAKA